MHTLRMLWAAHNEEVWLRRQRRNVSRRSLEQIAEMPGLLFKERFRLDKQTFNQLCIELRGHTSLRGTKEIPLEVKVLCTLSFLATGSYQRIVGVSQHLPQRTASRCVSEVVEALNSVYIMNKYIVFPQTQEERSRVRQEFQRKFYLPGVIGCIDCTHIAIVKPDIEEHLYFNRKGYHSLNVQMICDHNLKIFNVNARYGGATHDAFIWSSSQAEVYMRGLHQSGEQTWLLGDRTVLHNVSGEFRSGELTCILGPSGAGKSSLLNILAGYTSNGVSGRITVNGHARDMHVFKKLSSYIMQDDLLQPRLTVSESMRIAADLKLGKELGSAEKELIVEEILQTLGLWEHRNTMSHCLSGGQSKRLSVALELVNNPPMIFIDEPTTGLDIVSIRQLVVLLRLLSRQGRTIVCTVHQPSASLFSLFDRIYIVARGMCCYQGAAPLLVPFLSELGHVCPTTHNPADFVLETLSGDTEAAAQMSELCQNGKLCRKLDRITLRGGRKPVLHSDESIQRIFVEHVAKEQMQKVEFPTTFLTQFFILTRRMFIQNRRNSTTLWIQLAHHLLSSILLGSIFYMVGNDGNVPVVNFKYCLSCVVFFMYTYIMVPVLLFPMEVRMLRREYFNRWYSLKAYYAALTLASLPVMTLLGLLFMGIGYLMSGQLLEWDRFILFSISGLLTAICSEGLGLAVGSTFSVANGSIIGPATAAPLLALSCYGMGFGPYIEGFMKFLMSTSYLRYGLTGFSLALYEKRELMDCHEDFCLYADPALLLRDVGMKNDSYTLQVFGLLAFTVLHRVIAYFALRYQLTAEFSSKFMMYISKMLKHR